MTNAIDPSSLRRRVGSVDDESSRPETPNCESERYEDYDFDHCGTEGIARPVLFARQQADIDEVAPLDVLQSDLGDCYLLAPLIAMANVPEGRATIKAAIVERKSETGEPIYTVTLHRRDPISPDKFIPVNVTVSALYPHGRAAPRQAGSLREVWPTVIEKAYAQYLGGYNQIARGGNVPFAMETLTGKPAEAVAIEPPPGRLRSIVPTAPNDVGITRPSPGYAADRLRSDLAAQKLVVLASRSALVEPNERGIAAFHAYVVVGIQDDGDGLVVKLRDPLDALGTKVSVPYGELSKWFKAAAIGSAR
jgi:Calpain family cysteine protease